VNDRGRRLIAVALSAVLAIAAVASASALTPAPTMSQGRDLGCPAAFPARLTPRPAGNLYSRALAGLVVCSDRTGTATLVTNSTDAVWVIDEPQDVIVHRDPTTSLNRSFLRLIHGERTAIPAGSSVRVFRPASSLRLVIDPYLTLAQLTHDQLAFSLAAQSPFLLDGTIQNGLELNRATLLRCVRAVLAPLRDPGPLLAGGNPAPRLTETAATVAANGAGGCSEAWVDTKLNAGVPRGSITSLASDVRAWRRDARFAIRSISASIAYWALTQTGNEPPGSATG
jgi:hypothetical protein